MEPECNHEALKRYGPSFERHKEGSMTELRGGLHQIKQMHIQGEFLVTLWVAVNTKDSRRREIDGKKTIRYSVLGKLMAPSVLIRLTKRSQRKIESKE